MKFHFFIFFFSFIVGTVQLLAQDGVNNFTYNAGTLTFWCPDEWKVSEENDVAMLVSPDEGMVITFSVTGTNEMEMALMELEEALLAKVKEPAFTTEPEFVDLNGMSAVMAEVSGKLENDTPVQIGVFVIDRPNSFVIMLGIAQNKAMDKYSTVLEKIISKIEPLD